MSTDKSAAAIRELVERWMGKKHPITMRSYVSDLTALISEGYVSREEHEADIEFLARRQQKAGGISFTEERETGISSNSIVAIAYGIVKLADQSFPYDWSDLNACRNMWKKLPEHRKVGDALIAMQRAEAAIKNTER